MLQLAGSEIAKDEQDQAKKILFTYPMIKETDMTEDMKVEVLEVCVNACEKHTSNNESAAKTIKESLDKKFGCSWHVVVGEGFGFEVSYEIKNLMYMFFAGNLACMGKPVCVNLLDCSCPPRPR
eukprot:snap_masked-scaffold784_size97500-processed-gene-0.4 protein:Tk02998 transcript:snap_masked-scaffold784_size97500-processed-gene-0.4-mRNA-1 annotation:"hypothetical protein CAPTEDRAFT_157041"